MLKNVKLLKLAKTHCDDIRVSNFTLYTGSGTSPPIFYMFVN